MAILSEESAKIDRGDQSTVVPVNGSEGSEWRVVILDLKLSLEGFELPLEVDLLLEDSRDSNLDVPWEEFKSYKKSFRTAAN